MSELQHQAMVHSLVYITGLKEEECPTETPYNLHLDTSIALEAASWETEDTLNKHSPQCDSGNKTSPMIKRHNKHLEFKIS